jgi:ectoine hydroxylase-related dioxygenase (phytanoyl-CoA dioxygenase family)
LTWDELVRKQGYPITNASMNAGDATFHGGWTLHTAPPNNTDVMREVMTVIYYEDGVRVMDNPDNENRRIDLARWLPGAKPGEPAVSPLNPVLLPV